MNEKLQPLLNYLESLTEQADSEVLAGLLADVSIAREDIEEYCNFQDDWYCRTKVSGSDWYDFYFICWKPGQCSHIHDHRDSGCVFKVISGQAVELRCKSTRENYVVPVEENTYAAGNVCVSYDDYIHQVSNDEELNEELVTLHVYSPPLKMNTYEWDPNYLADLDQEPDDKSKVYSG